MSIAPSAKPLRLAITGMSCAGCVASVENGSEHPLAQTILNAAHQRGLAIHNPERFYSHCYTATAFAIAAEAGIDTVFAEIPRTGKAEIIATLETSGEIVGMAGDGINDAPALARAAVGFAMGTGTDIAIESAGITLVGGSLHGIADAIAISRATVTNIRQNLLGAFLYNTLGIPIAAGALYPVTGLLLNPMLAGETMALSSFTVVSNANHLRAFQPRGTSK